MSRYYARQVIAEKNLKCTPLPHVFKIELKMAPVARVRLAGGLIVCVPGVNGGGGGVVYTE